MPNCIHPGATTTFANKQRACPKQEGQEGGVLFCTRPKTSASIVMGAIIKRMNSQCTRGNSLRADYWWCRPGLGDARLIGRR